MTENKPEMVVDDLVVSLAYKLTVDGEVLDEAGDEDALEFLQGHRNIISGLESQLAGMKVGERKSVAVPAANGYGEVDKELINEVPLSEFPEEVEPEVGMELELKDKEGNEMYGKVLAMQGETATMDFNHPLAGKELHFDVKIVGLRLATGEELAHGHVHAHGHHH
ncbi:MAG: peptidylprolyl isomerase [Anaerolineales bacterium]